MTAVAPVDRRNKLHKLAMLCFDTGCQVSCSVSSSSLQIGISLERVAAGNMAAVQELISSSGLQQALAWNMLPLLTLRELGCTAASCRSFRDCAYRREELWSSNAETFLPPGHPSLSSSDRASVQQVMSSRALARSHIISGQTKTQQVAVCARASAVLFSPSARHCAVFLHEEGSLVLISVQVGAELWRKDVRSTMHPLGFHATGWYFGVDHLALYHHTSESHRAENEQSALGWLNLTLIEVCNGERRDKFINLSEAVGSDDYKFDLKHPIPHAYSPSGRLLAVHLSVVEAATGAQPNPSCFVLVIEIATCTVKLKHALGRAHSLLVMSSFQGGNWASWARFETALLWGNLLVGILQNTVVVLPGQRACVEYEKACFDRSGSLLAYTVYSQSSGLGSTNYMTKIWDIGTSKPQRGVFTVQEHNFVQHFATRRWAMLHCVSHNLVQIWNLDDRKLMYTISLGTSTPQLALDDRVIFGQAILPAEKLLKDDGLLAGLCMPEDTSCWNHESKLCFWHFDPDSGTVSDASLCLRGVVKYMPDECSFACIRSFNSTYSEVYLAKLS